MTGAADLPERELPRGRRHARRRHRPARPKNLVEGFGDFTLNGKSQTHSNQVHSAFGWVNEKTGRAYVVMTDDEEATDTDIIDITNPSRPTFVAEYDFAPQSRQPLGAVHGDAPFIHDEVVKRIGDATSGSSRTGTAATSRSTSPTRPGRATSATPTTRPSTPSLLEATGTSLSPEGNAHQAEFTRGNRFFVGTDEDFDPFSRRSRCWTGLTRAPASPPPRATSPPTSTRTPRSPVAPAPSGSPATRRLRPLGRLLP